MKHYTWNQVTKRLLKSELVKRGISHDELVLRLKGIGVRETRSSISSKLSRGSFSASFLLQCLHVIGCEKLQVEDELLLAAEPKVEYEIRG